jgi:bleomycin hydrolase
MLGTPPTTFTDQEGLSSSSRGKSGKTAAKKSSPSKKTTPLSYLKDVVAPCLHASGYVCLTNDPRQPNTCIFSTQYAIHVIPQDSANKKLSELTPNIFFNVPTHVIKQAAVSALKNGHPLWFSCDVHKYYDPESLILNARASNMGLLSGEDDWKLPKNALYDSGIVENSHAMTLVGYDEADRNWKVENSWGQDTSIVMTDKWFDRFVMCVVVPLSALPATYRQKYRSEIKAMEEDVHACRVLPIWDVYSSPQKLFS